MEKCHCAGRRDLEYSAVVRRASLMRRAVEIPVPPLYQGGVRRLPIGHASREGVDQSLDPRRSDFKNRTRVIRTTGKRSPIEVAVAGLNQSRRRSTRISKARKRMEYRLTAGGRDHKDHTAS